MCIRDRLCADGESFHSLLCLSGSGAVICGGGAVPFAKGDSLFLSLIHI